MAYDKENLDPERCKARVPDGLGWHDWQCSRKVKRDGYCTQHHPETARLRQEKNARKRENNVFNVRLRRNVAMRLALEGFVNGWNTDAELIALIDNGKDALTSDHRITNPTP